MPRFRRQRRTSAAVGLIEPLEPRVLLTSVTALLATLSNSKAYLPGVTVSSTASTLYHPIVAVKKTASGKAASSAGPMGYLPSDIRSGYGVNQITFGSVVGDGTGQTIALIDAYDDPNALSDLNAFSSATGLPQMAAYTGNNTTPYFRRVAQDGSTNYPSTDPAGPNNANGTWEEEESLDIEWAHAIAPGANIILVEATTASNSDLISSAVGWARTQTGVSVISMSFGGSETSSETNYDSTFTTPSGHNGITFLASTGDDAEPGGYPAYSPNVVAVGGTSLTLSSGNYVSESGWNDGGGGISTVESKPSYQANVTQSSTKRTEPDVAMDADPNTGVAVYDSWDFGTTDPWGQFGGTSLATPMFGGLIAIADQGRALLGLGTLDGPTQTLPDLYSAPAADFHDITTGNNGFAAGVGYDLVTGLGSPVANLLVPTLVGGGTVSGKVYSDNNDDGVYDAGDTPIAGATVFIDTNGNGVPDNSSATVTDASTDVPLAIPDDRTSGITSTLAVSGLSTITNLSITFNITHTYDSDLIGFLTSPSGTTVELWDRVGSSGHNFTNTILSSTATTSINNGTAPFSGTYLPSPGSLTSFNGQAANGTWKFKVEDVARQDTGTINSWSLTITTGNTEQTVTTDANGNYSFDLGNGTYPITEVIPSGYLATTATAQNITVASNSSTLNFGNFPTVFNMTSGNTSYFVTANPNDDTKVQIYSGTSASGSPAYSAPLSLFSTSGLTFNLTGATNIVTVDYTNGNPAPGANLTVNGTYNSNEQLVINGGNPNANFNLTDYQIGPASGGNAVLFNTLPTLTLYSGTFNYSGSLSTLQNLNIDNGSTFMWN